MNSNEEFEKQNYEKQKSQTQNLLKNEEIITECKNPFTLFLKKSITFVIRVISK